ncbi:KRI1 family protein [Sporobolomyces koalae]|uniref:KRI1 family protein n=1 Tax=Sporobolomyces koalae TaxID=500713 RepID=UPI003172254F
MPELYDNSSDEEQEHDLNQAFKVNKGFADKYETKKRTEELSKLQDKYGKDYQFGDLEGESEEDSEDLSDDDEDAEFVTPQVDAAILRTLARIKAKDPAVYEPDRDVFQEEEERTAAASSLKKTKASSSSSSKPVLLKDYQRSRLLAENPHDDPEFATSNQAIPTPAQEQILLKNEILSAFHQDEGSDADSDDDVFTKREQGDDERMQEEQEYEKFLETNVGKKAVKAALGDEEDFLRDYILNRGWLDRENDSTRIPSYAEITGDQDDHKRKKSSKGKSKLLDEDDDEVKLNPGAHDDDDDDFEDRAEEFEHKYNFRFEEDAGANLVTHARDALSTVRKPTAAVSARARQREAAKQKKEEEKLARKEEVRRLKALKRKQVEEKLLQLVEAAGQGTTATNFEDLDLDGEWDEAKHEAQMKQIYGDDYDAADDDGFKPTWDDDIDITDLVGPDGSDDDDDPALHMPFASTSALQIEDEEEDTGLSKKERKKQKKLAQANKKDEEGFPTALMAQAKQGGDEEQQKMLERLEDEYYGIEYEDKIGDVKTRFRYTKVAPSGFNLTPEEILLATDAELNAFMSLKKIAPYRMSESDQSKQRKKLKELKDALKNRKWGDEVDETKALEELEKRKEKKRKWRAEGKEKDRDATGANAVEVAGGERPTKKKRAGKSERKRLQAERGAAPDA